MGRLLVAGCARLEKIPPEVGALGDSFYSTGGCFWKRSPVEFLNSLTPGRSSPVLVSTG